MDLLSYPFDGALILQKKRALKKELLARGGHLLEKKVAIVSGSTIGDIRPILELFLLHSGIQPLFFEGEYGLFYEDVVFDDGKLAAFAPDVLYIHTSARNLRHWPDVADSDEAAAQKQSDEYARFSAVWQAAQKLGCPILQNNFELPAFRHFGNLDASDLRGRTGHVRRLNEQMAAYARQTPGFYIHDFAWLAAQHGQAAFCDDAAWYAYKYACAPAYIPHLCHSLAGQIQSLFGLSKKGLVLDLDNTLWGGVVGEVGPDGIEIGSETPQGEAYAEFQSYLAMLARRGILLNVASKNEEPSAEAGLSRDESVLKREDFLCFEAGWNPKSQSVQAIAQALNIGADALVFVDDNPAERDEVQRVLPQVAAPPVSQPEDSIRLLDGGGYFEASTLSQDDLARSGMYRENQQRAQSQSAFASYDDYLKNLAMTADILPFLPEHLERVTQLINKTNQFNLTTRRYTAAEVAQRAESDGYVTLSARLVDKFGDNGITSALIGRIDGSTLCIELWVMSCRVFKRGLEYAVFDTLVKKAQSLGVTTITGRYLPTAKNLLVRDFYATIGFDLTGEGQDGERDFRFAVPAEYTPLNTAIEVRE